MKKYFVIIVLGLLCSCEKKMPEDLESTRSEIEIRVERIDGMNLEELNKLKSDLVNYSEDANRRGFSKDNSELVNEISSRISKLEKRNVLDGVWSSMNQLSNLYINNGIYDVVTSMEFSQNGKVEIYEGGGNEIKSCVCAGIYRLQNNSKELVISDVNSKNCPWLNKFNGTYTYSKDIYDLFTNNETNIRIEH